MSALPPGNPTAADTAVGSDFRLVSIRSAPAPADSAGRDWFTYCIAQGTNLINGYRRGDLDAVTVEVEKIVAALNERRVGRRGRVDLRPNRPPARTSGT
ncbi:MAG TPA: hypothetical protein VHH11_02075 [Gammaproteobacteria bacterium]|nr:hypothetical protein [Gammaproteobacteria bacterium]